MIICCGLIIRWTINTKYYTADVSVWTAHLCDEFSIASFPVVDRLVALVMVFDINDVSIINVFSSFVALQFDSLFLSMTCSLTSNLRYTCRTMDDVISYCTLLFAALIPCRS